MRLTNLIRDAFVTAAMQDVPKVDYQTEAHKIAIADSVEALPAQLRPLALDKNLSQFFNMRSHWFHNSPFQSVSVFAPRGGDFRLSATAEKKIAQLEVKAEAQRAERNALSGRLRGAAYGCTTRKALAELLPEFEKYLPKEEEKAGRSLPVIANLVADFTKAGWPKAKGEQNQQTKVAA